MSDKHKIQIREIGKLVYFALNRKQLLYKSNMYLTSIL